MYSSIVLVIYCTVLYIGPGILPYNLYESRVHTINHMNCVTDVYIRHFYTRAAVE